MALTFEETKLLVKVLLKELQTMQMKLDKKPNINQTSQNEKSEVEIARESVIFANENNDIKQNDPLSNTENKIEFSTNLEDNTEEFSNVI